jgi:hypothetical protein
MKVLTLAALVAAAPMAVQAETLVLTAPMAAGTLHEESADMSVYWLPDGSAYEVTAVYVEPAEPAAPLSVRMRLEEGDSVVFGLPGVEGVSYAFAREGDALTVTTAPAPTRQAMK